MKVYAYLPNSVVNKIQEFLLRSKNRACRKAGRELKREREETADERGHINVDLEICGPHEELFDDRYPELD